MGEIEAGTYKNEILLAHLHFHDWSQIELYFEKKIYLRPPTSNTVAKNKIQFVPDVHSQGTVRRLV